MIIAIWVKFRYQHSNVKGAPMCGCLATVKTNREYAQSARVLTGTSHEERKKMLLKRGEITSDIKSFHNFIEEQILFTKRLDQ
jgi:hypothetical protein